MLHRKNIEIRTTVVQVRSILEAWHYDDNELRNDDSVRKTINSGQATGRCQTGNMLTLSKVVDYPRLFYAVADYVWQSSGSDLQICCTISLQEYCKDQFSTVSRIRQLKIWWTRLAFGPLGSSFCSTDQSESEKLRLSMLVT